MGRWLYGKSPDYKKNKKARERRKKGIYKRKRKSIWSTFDNLF